MLGRRRHRLSGLMRRVTASEGDLYAEQVRAESRRSGCVACASAVAGDRVKVSGRITTVTFMPTAPAPLLEAELFDGTATITLTWWGRRRLLGIEPGRQLVAAGRIVRRDGDRKVIYNPWYEIAAAGDDI